MHGLLRDVAGRGVTSLHPVLVTKKRKHPQGHPQQEENGEMRSMATSSTPSPARSSPISILELSSIPSSWKGVELFASNIGNSPNETQLPTTSPKEAEAAVVPAPAFDLAPIYSSSEGSVQSARIGNVHSRQLSSTEQVTIVAARLECNPKGKELILNLHDMKDASDKNLDELKRVIIKHPSLEQLTLRVDPPKVKTSSPTRHPTLSFVAPAQSRAHFQHEQKVLKRPEEYSVALLSVLEGALATGATIRDRPSAARLPTPMEHEANQLD